MAGNREPNSLLKQVDFSTGMHLQIVLTGQASYPMDEINAIILPDTLYLIFRGVGKILNDFKDARSFI